MLIPDLSVRGHVVVALETFIVPERISLARLRLNAEPGDTLAPDSRFLQRLRQRFRRCLLVAFDRMAVLFPLYSTRLHRAALWCIVGGRGPHRFYNRISHRLHTLFPAVSSVPGRHA